MVSDTLTPKIVPHVWIIIFFLSAFLLISPALHAQIRHYVFFSTNREGIRDTAFYKHAGIEGAQIAYHWKLLEPKKDLYDFSRIEEDLAYLDSHGKKLWIQVQDVTFLANNYACPDYLRTDPEYHGGTNAQYEITPKGRPAHGGNVTRRWDPAVAARFHQLLYALAAKFDGRIAGINVPETAVSFPDTLGLRPSGFTPERYLEAVKANMQVMRTAFRKSIPLQYANFMPDDPQASFLHEVYRYAQSIGIGIGGPDIKVYRRFQMKHSYPLIRDSYGKIPTGAAVQDGNYSIINDNTKKPVTVPEILAFGRDYLRLSYMFWCTEEPFYTKEVLPMLRR